MKKFWAMLSQTFSERWTLNLKDLFNGLMMAIIGGVLTFVYSLINPCLDSFSQGVYCSMDFRWDSILLVAVGSGLAYLVKRFGSDTKGNLPGIEPENKK